MTVIWVGMADRMSPASPARIWKGFGIDHWLATATHRREIMTSELWRLLRDGALDLPVSARYALDDIRSAVAAASTSPPGAKVLVII
jgi:NADPH:quinone reductase-like Zn-dependent oxidoreductase